MSWVAVAVAGSSLVGGLLGSDAASNAANTQAQATRDASAATAAAQDRATTELGRQYDTTRTDLAPYRAAGATALTQLSSGVGSDGMSGPLQRRFSASDFWNDPVVQAGYQSGLDLGTKALKNQAPLTYGADSGAAAKELLKFGTDYTGQMAAGSYGRFVGDQGNQFGHLAALAGIGQSATNTGASTGAATAGNIAATTMAGGTNLANLISSGGNARAASQIAGANAISGGLTSVANWWNQQQMLNRLAPQGYTPSNYNTSYVGPMGYNPSPE